MGVTGARPPGTGRELLPAYGVCAVTALSVLAWAGLAFTYLDGDATRYDQFHYSVQVLLLGLGLTLSGMAFLARRSAAFFGWFLLVTGAASTVGNTLVLSATLGSAPRFPAQAGIFVMTVVFALFAVLLYSLPLWLPDGRLHGRPARVYVAFLTVVCFVRALYHWSVEVKAWLSVPNPMARGGWGEFWRGTRPVMRWADTWGVDGLLYLAVLFLAVRMIRSAEFRRSTYWFTVPYIAWCTVITLADHASPPDSVKIPLLYAASLVWPLSLGYLHARTRTWVLDRAARRVLVSLLLTIILVAAFTLAVGLLLNLAPHDTKASRLLPAAALGLAVGALLRPAARGASRLVDHYFYGDRAHPYQVVRGLAGRLAAAPGPGDAPGLLADTVVRVLGLPAVSVAVRTKGGLRELVRGGEEGAGAEDFPIVYRGEEIGRLRVAPRAGELALDAQDREAVQVLAAQAAPALDSQRLYQDLRSSREQLIHAREEERRRLRHELHDGLGPALSGLRLQVDAVRRAAGARVAEPLSGVSDGIGYAIKELRHITDGLAPAALDGADLTRALRQLAEHLSSRSLRIGVAVDPDPLPPLPAALQVAVYRITSEALNNVVRHSHADWAQALVSASHGRVSLRISDNGDGFPAHEHCVGVGLRSMAQRSEELGGEFTLTSSTDGTVVDAAFPAAPGTG